MSSGTRSQTSRNSRHGEDNGDGQSLNRNTVQQAKGIIMSTMIGVDTTPKFEGFKRSQVEKFESELDVYKQRLEREYEANEVARITDRTSFLSHFQRKTIKQQMKLDREPTDADVKEYFDGIRSKVSKSEITDCGPVVRGLKLKFIPMERKQQFLS